MLLKKYLKVGPRSAGLVLRTVGRDSLLKPLLLQLRHGGLSELLHQFYVNGLWITQSTNAINKEIAMCFRPGGVEKPQECPKCGKKLVALGGVKQKVCPFCKTPLDQEEGK